MSDVDLITDEDIQSLKTKNEMLSLQLEQAYAMIDIALAECDHKVCYSYLHTEAKKIVAAQTKTLEAEVEEESHPPRIETIID